MRRYIFLLAFLLVGCSSNDVDSVIVPDTGQRPAQLPAQHVPDIANVVVQDFVRNGNDEGGSLLDSLTPREREVLHLIADGLSAKEIASDLGISTKTVEAHRTSLMRKLGARKATELVRYALRHGLVEP